ncbi:hypothetical protein LTR10_002753 [Elasticomyces elasticus]|nr:hypothetical protein LTR10_002753 [Elasticomyces elasticus]KAK4967907.1 hypothetical protein LTR42_010235 [Elasticomyces elasticus]
MSTSRKVPIRTGCLSCRARGIRCDPTNPTCQRFTSASWTSNRKDHSKSRSLANDASQARSLVSEPGVISKIDVSWEGTHREKQSLYFFSNFTAPELAGWFDRSFWGVSILQAATLDQGIKHLVAAIGAVHESQLRKQVSRNTNADGLHAFALRQCNKAIKDLVRPPTQASEADMLRTLTASILFACLESMQVERKAAVPHIVSARRLFKQYKVNYERSYGQEGTKYPTRPREMDPLIAHYEVQLGDSSNDSLPSDAYHGPDLALPLNITSIMAARIPLERALAACSNDISMLGKLGDAASANAIAAKKTTYRQWFVCWDLAFARFLSLNVSQLDGETLNASRLLKAHQTAAIVLTSVEYGVGEVAWAAFTEEFRAIVALVTEIVASRPRQKLASQAPQTAYFSTSMGITEPLYCAAARCVDPAIARRARILLDRLPQNEGAHSPWRISFIEMMLCAATGKHHEVETGSTDLTDTSASCSNVA